MKFILYVAVFFFTHFFVVQSLSCPYQGEARTLANSLTECLDSSSTFVLVKDLVSCVASFIKDKRPVHTGEIVREVIQYALIRKEDYKECSENYNKLLESILIYQKGSNEITNYKRPEGVSAKVAKLVNDARAYHNYYCDTIDIQFDKDIDEYITKKQLSVEGMNFEMYVYRSGDIVSDNIIRGGSWEIGEVRQILYGLESHQKKMNIHKNGEVMFLDVGGQIGWYTTIIGRKGYKVFSFEPMKINQYIIRHNLCMDKSIDITYINKGLDKEEKVCHLYSETSNVGNAELFCDENERPTSRRNRGAIELMKLDDFVYYLKNQNLAVIKMDIEGNEYNAVKGGRKIFLEMHVPYIVTEYSPFMMEHKGADPIMYVQEFIDAGYKVSTNGFDRTDNIDINYIKGIIDKDSSNYKHLNINLFFTYKGS